MGKLKFVEEISLFFYGDHNIFEKNEPEKSGNRLQRRLIFPFYGFPLSFNKVFFVNYIKSSVIFS